jgi:hypothetical protein
MKKTVKLGNFLLVNGNRIYFKETVRNVPVQFLLSRQIIQNTTGEHPKHFTGVGRGCTGGNVEFIFDFKIIL